MKIQAFYFPFFNKMYAYLKPCTSALVLCTFLFLSANSLQAQTKFDLAGLNGADGITLNNIFTSSVAAGDINGDGIEDLVIGGLSGPGTTYVVFGGTGIGSIGPTDLDGTNGFFIFGIDPGDQAGYSVATGDINGDGTGDVIIGARFADPGGEDSAGEAYVVFGGSSVGSSGGIQLSNLNGTNGFVLNGDDANDESGTAVAAGDINGDGIDDIIIGAPGSGSDFLPNRGETYIIFGSSGVGSSGSIVLTSAANGSGGFRIFGGSEDDFSGAAVAAGDTNGDGIDDVIIGARFADPEGRGNAGESYVVFGGSDVSANLSLDFLNGTNGFVLNGIDQSDQSGDAVATGDINGDGTDDILIGAGNADPGGISNAGETYIVFGGGSVGNSGSLELSSLNGTNGFVLNGIADSDGNGFMVTAGDINGDGNGDVITSAFGGAETYVVFGGAGIGSTGSIELSSLNGSNGLSLFSSDGSANKIGAGDINDDGVEDLLIGFFGEAYVYFNRAGQVITGSEGFRTLSAPVSGSVFDDLLSPFWTQGFSGANTSGGDPNVWVWDPELNTNAVPNSGDFIPLFNQSTDVLNPGQGFLLYLFSDDDSPGVGDDAGFPKNIATAAPFFGGSARNTGTVNPVSSLPDGRFFFAGNPYEQTVDWDLMTRSGLSSTIYVYDNANGTFQSWNGSVGGLAGGLIAPFQGFFIRGFGGSGSLTMEEDDISGSTPLLKTGWQEQPLALELKLESGEQSNTTWFHFDEQALPGEDALDGLQLQPLAGSYLQVFTKDPSGNSLSINALPLSEKQFEVPLKLLKVESGTAVDAQAILSVSGLSDFPANWKFTLIDTQTGQETDLKSRTEIPVQIAGTNNKVAVLSVPSPQIQKVATENRYVLRIQTKASQNNSLAGIPAAVELIQNYPNPFNPETVIRYGVPEQSRVNLEVYDMLGRQVATLLNNAPRSPGRYELSFDASRLASGLYIYRLKVGSNVVTRKMTLIK